MGMGKGMDGYGYGYGYGWVWMVWVWVVSRLRPGWTIPYQDKPLERIQVYSFYSSTFIDMKNIQSDCIACDMPFAEFHELCSETYKVPYSFVLINKDEHSGSGKYLKNLNQLYIPQKYFSGNRSRLSPEFSVKECAIG
jgi:hypothetical protein